MFIVHNGTQCLHGLPGHLCRESAQTCLEIVPTNSRIVVTVEEEEGGREDGVHL